MKPGGWLWCSLLACLLLLSSCDLEQASSAVPSAEASVSDSPASPPADLHCSLPVNDLPPPYPAAAGAWLAFPNGQLRVDAAGAGTIRGANGPSYNWRFKRWLPVPWNLQSPDGSSYTYASGDGVHVVDTDSGADRLILGTSDLLILKYEADYIYARRNGGFELWRINPASGTVEMVLDQGLWLSVGQGAAWGFTPATVAAKQLVRVDLHDASTSLWYTRALVVDVLGIDAAGRPVVVIGTGSPGNADLRMHIEVLSAPDRGDAYYPADGPWNQSFFQNDLQAPVDDHGVWLPWPHGIYLLRAQPAGVVKVSDGYVPAGACG